MGSQTALLIGVGANPGALNMDEELRRFEWKVKAGAEYVVTQPVFDLDLLEAFLKRTEQYRLPVIAGIWPLTSYPQCRVHGERAARAGARKLTWSACAAPKTRKPRAPKASRSRRRWCSACDRMVAGVQLSAPFGRYQMAIEVAEAIGPRSTP